MPPRQAPSARSTEGGSGAVGQGNATDMSMTAPAGKPAPTAAKPQTGYKNASELVKVYELFSDENVAARINAGEAAAAIAADYARMMAPAMQKARTKDAREITKYDIAQTAAEEAKALYGEEVQSKLLGRPLTAPEQASLKKQFDAEFQNRAAKALRAASAFAKSAWGKDLEDGGPREVPPQDMQPQEDTPQEPQEFTQVKSVAGFGDAKQADRAYDVPDDDKAKKAEEAKARIKKGIEAWAGARKDSE